MARYAQQSKGINGLMARVPLQRGWVFGLMIIGALLAFEMFNYSTTDFALTDLLGGLEFLGLKWGTILSLAFCGIDFAGIARLFTPEEGADEPAEVWYLFGAWLLAATMNAMLTWWGVSIAILEHPSLGNAIVERATLLKVVPIFVAVMVWLSRVLIIGTFSVAGERLFSQAIHGQRQSTYTQRNTSARPAPSLSNQQRPMVSRPASFKPSPKPKTINRPRSNYNSPSDPTGYSQPEPTYHPIGASPRNNGNNGGYRS